MVIKMLEPWQIIQEEIANPIMGDRPRIDVNDMWAAGWYEGYFKDVLTVDNCFFYCLECEMEGTATIVDMYAWGYDYHTVKDGGQIRCPVCDDVLAESFEIMEFSFVSSFNRRLLKMCIERGYIPEGYDPDLYGTGLR